MGVKLQGEGRKNNMKNRPISSEKALKVNGLGCRRHRYRVLL